jgi:hypothetical protein
MRDGVEYDSEGFVTGLLKPYSTDWAHGGPIIQREGISLLACTSMMPPGQWHGYNAENARRMILMWGETPLEAAMRCYVASIFGDTVDETGVTAPSGQAAFMEPQETRLPASIDPNSDDKDAWV